jgi:hypothetical protein
MSRPAHKTCPQLVHMVYVVHTAVLRMRLNRGQCLRRYLSSYLADETGQPFQG